MAANICNGGGALTSVNAVSEPRSRGTGSQLSVAQLTPVVSWNGPDDPDNPRNYSPARRLFATLASSLLAFVTTFAASIYSPGSKQISTHQEIAILPSALYNLGSAFGPLIGSPLGETHGRKAVVLITTPIFAFFTLGAGLSSNVASLTICRFFAGVFAAPAVGNASATIMDFTSERSRGSAMDFYYSVPTLGASLGPSVGGFVVQYRGWRWTQWTILFFTVAFYVPVVFTRETYKQTILWRRAKKLGIQGPPRARRTVLQSVHHFVATLLLRPIHMLLTEPIVTLVCLYNGFMFGLMYTYVVASPWVYSHYYGFNQTAVNLSFLGLVIGCIIAPIVLLTIEKLIFQPRLAAFRRNHTAETSFPPENRLYPAMMASFGSPATLFAFAWTTRKSIHWICPMILQGLTMVCNSMVYASANLFMMDVYGPLYGASAAGAAMLSRYLLSAAFPSFSLQMYQSLGVGSATSILACIAFVLAPVPFLFFYAGERLRARTKYETSR